MILHIVGVNSNIFAHKLIKGINLAHDSHYFDGRVNSNPVLVLFAVLIPYLCFEDLEQQSVVERLRAAD